MQVLKKRAMQHVVYCRQPSRMVIANKKVVFIHFIFLKRLSFCKYLVLKVLYHQREYSFLTQCIQFVEYKDYFKIIKTKFMSAGNKIQCCRGEHFWVKLNLYILATVSAYGKILAELYQSQRFQNQRMLFHV